MVVLAIITVIMLVVLTSQSTFNKTIVLANTAYDIALTIRSAETFGLSSRVLSIATANTGYGINFQKTTPESFTLFADSYPGIGQPGLCHPPPVNDPTGPNAKPGNCSYDAVQGEKVTTYTLGNGITVDDFCAYNGAWSCANSDSLASLDIVFVRSTSEPFISVNGAYSLVTPATAACLKVTSRQGGARFVYIGASGIITANATSCP
ncbi:hypothetical protein A3A36_00545 [Candidatus Kaiserbacteria bacterium RIFCSPLOWO2_01_FULL_52_12b]|uniref:Uncharacterized protein n=1 Tax=Candidatus Kaiserbacteria bacterium RIFCSPLOWO2_01_FULL_52_12b TaxID=1798509 RepID=A0A1F6EYA5_9BACT|nr:MAG: hypothetical protein A3A36_00545 [Candidatus Kaiserbacteria bacterium RIFCSPLOWO2_01_FULL_52_12b]